MITELEINDTDLMQKISNQDKKALDLLNLKYKSLIHSVAFKVLNSAPDAEDVAQDVFAMIWSKSSMYDVSRGKISTWLGTITRNKAIDKYRSINRRYKLSNDLILDSKTSDQLDTQSPDENVSNIEKNTHIRNAVIRLNKNQKEVIEMLYFKGLSQKEIASRIKKPLSTVKARLHRGLVKLREIIPYSI